MPATRTPAPIAPSIAEIEGAEDISVRKLTLAVDVGEAINPDGVINQIEGGAIQATSWVLKERVRFDRQRITSTSWTEYPILRFSEVPDVEVELIQRPEMDPVGAGEAAHGPVTAAIANAVFDALGVRVRDLPITRDSIIAAMELTSMNNLNILSGGAAQGLVGSLAPAFKAQTGFDIAGEFGAVGAMADKLREGTPADIVILTAALVAKLAEEKLVVAASIADVGLVETALAVRAGDPQRHGERCRRLARGAAGRGRDLRAGHQGLDGRDSRRESPCTARHRRCRSPPGCRIFPNGATAMRELAASDARRPIGCTQSTEIISTDGVILSGSLPPGCELATMYTADQSSCREGYTERASRRKGATRPNARAPGRRARRAIAAGRRRLTRGSETSERRSIGMLRRDSRPRSAYFS